MKSKLLSMILVCAACLLVQHANAQCGSGPRYVDTVFPGYTVTTVTYSTGYNLQMDVYQPAGDVNTSRPLIVLAHGGSFTSGNRSDDSTIIWLCRDLATKGYVTASIDYRLTTNTKLVYPFNGDSAIVEVLEAVGDGKAAVRYFYKDVLTNGNTFKIDTNNIFIGGNSAGAVLFMQYAYITDISQLNPSFQAIVASIGGGLDGVSGNPGYSSNFKGVINLAGALNQAAWINNCSKPLVSAQGTADAIVPYQCGNPEQGAVQVQLCGLGAMSPFITAHTTLYDTLTFPGAGHVPWQNGGNDFYRVDTLITGFLNKALCAPTLPTCVLNTTGVEDVKYNADISLYPNPASNMLNVTSSQFFTAISIVDETGRIVAQVNDIRTLNYQLNTSGLSAGIYLVRINDALGHTPAVRKLVIQ
jgi:para-nitrobenzyl esterase